MGLVADLTPSTASTHDPAHLECTETSLQTTLALDPGLSTTQTAPEPQTTSEAQVASATEELPQPSSSQSPINQGFTADDSESDETDSFFDCTNIGTNSGFVLHGPLAGWAADLPDDIPAGDGEADPGLFETQRFEQRSQLNIEEMDRLIQACDAPTRAYRTEIAKLTSTCASSLA